MAAGVGMLLWLGWQSADRQAASAPRGLIRVGQPAPDFSLPALNGETIRLNDLKGQVVLVNLWATWCPPCKAEMPVIDTFYQAQQQAGFTALMVNAQEDGATVQAFIKANGFGFPVLLDSQGELMNLYGVRGLPTTFIVDRNGLVRHIQSGAITEAELEAVVSPLLK
ncbi:MAG: TlpA disulfide reductase family protein [Anaerolineae bacterium]